MKSALAFLTLISMTGLLPSYSEAKMARPPVFGDENSLLMETAITGFYEVYLDSKHDFREFYNSRKADQSLVYSYRRLGDNLKKHSNKPLLNDLERSIQTASLVENENGHVKVSFQDPNGDHLNYACDNHGQGTGKDINIHCFACSQGEAYSIIHPDGNEWVIHKPCPGSQPRFK